MSYLIRNLLNRLGLLKRPSQVRFIASSASLEKGRDDAFLEGFFGADPATFEVIAGEIVRPQSARPDLSEYAEAFASVTPSTPEPYVRELVNKTNPQDALLLAAMSQGKVLAQDIQHFGTALFPGRLLMFRSALCLECLRPSTQQARLPDD